MICSKKSREKDETNQESDDDDNIPLNEEDQGDDDDGNIPLNEEDREITMMATSTHHNETSRSSKDRNAPSKCRETPRKYYVDQ